VLTPEARQQIESLKKVYETHQSALIPALHIAQADQTWLSEETQREVALILGLTAQSVREVVTFYTMFQQKPVGRHMIQVCRNLSCALLGGQRLQNQVQEKLKIADGETTQDGRFTYVSVECLGSCGTAPVLMVNDRYYENVTPPQLDRLLDELK
jgi:NADH-quinone oxidoreductase E subunit